MTKNFQTFFFTPAIFPLLLPFSLPHLPLIVAYSVIYVITSLIFILLCKIIMDRDISPRYVLVGLIVGIVLRLALIFIPPVGSDDYYNIYGMER